MFCLQFTFCLHFFLINIHIFDYPDASPVNEAEGQNTTSASRTKLLENGRDSETPTARD